MFRPKQVIFREAISFVDDHDLPKMDQRARNLKAERHKITVRYLWLYVQLAELNTVRPIYCTEYGKH